MDEAAQRGDREILLSSSAARGRVLRKGAVMLMLDTHEVDWQQLVLRCMGALARTNVDDAPISLF